MKHRESGVAGTGAGEQGTDLTRGPVPAALVPAPSPSDSRFPIPDSRVTVRRATLSDLSSIVMLRMALLREHAHNPIYGRLRADADARAAKLFAAQLQSPNEVIFLADLRGECAGILRCIQSSGSPLLDPSQYAYVSSVYVIPKAREQGVLRALLAAADGWCASRGLDEMRLHNAADNPLANAAWEALGFEVVEHLRVRSLKRR
jgi:ribosomal protein S18 acetylase RimI-like enzyme